MINIKRIMAAIIAALTAGFSIVLSLLSNKSKKLKSAQKDNEILKKTVTQKDNVIQASIKARKETNEKLESISTGDDSVDFKRSIDLLHDIACKRK